MKCNYNWGKEQQQKKRNFSFFLLYQILCQSHSESNLRYNFTMTQHIKYFIFSFKSLII
jgi:hypothetical protein